MQTLRSTLLGHSRHSAYDHFFFIRTVAPLDCHAIIYATCHFASLHGSRASTQKDQPHSGSPGSVSDFLSQMLVLRRSAIGSRNSRTSWMQLLYEVLRASTWSSASTDMRLICFVKLNPVGMACVLAASLLV